MEHKEILPVLYDLSVTIGGEIRLKSLLTRTLQRLLYHTSFSAGFVCLDMPSCEGSTATQKVRIEAAVGDFDLIASIDKEISVPCDLVYGCSICEVDQAELLSQLRTMHSQYASFLRLPLGKDGVIVLLAMQLPDTQLNLTQILQPVLAQLSKAIVLCRTHDEQEAASKKKEELLQQSLEQIESQYQSLIELSPIGVGLSSDGIVLDGNAAFLKLFGYAAMAELKGHHLTELIAPQKHAEMVERIRLRAQGKPVPDIYETVGMRKDGSQFPFMVSAKRVETEQGARTFTFFIDLTEQKRVEQQLRSVNDMMSAVLETVPVRIFWKDTESRYLGCNQVFAKDAGLGSPAELIGKDDSQMGWKDQATMYREDDRQVMVGKKSKLNFEEPQTTPDGHQIWLRTSKVPLQDGAGKVVGILGMYDDITEQKNAEMQIHQLAYFDSLTELPNRRLLQDRLQQAMAVSARNQHHGAVIFLDLDDFKTLNDTKGHSVGDLLLIEVGIRLIDCVRDGDTVARLGGDEFVVVLENLSIVVSEAATQAELVAEKIRSSLCEHYQLDGHEVHTSPSIGIVLFQAHQDSLDSLLQHADSAMYQAKQAGRNTIRFFDPKMQSELEERLRMADELRSAIDNEQLQLYFQKQVDSEGRAVGAEVLLRWIHPARGLVSPAQFIPLAEETGIILPIGLWVFQAACGQLKRWQGSSATRD
ncbi:MAG: hypothetical protein C0406_10465, partial [Sideroxydans sp.]|nr:hypothetical protein [Sideroxydans sp.]